MSATDFKAIVVKPEKINATGKMIVDLYLKKKSHIQGNDSYHSSYDPLKNYAAETRKMVDNASKNDQDCYERLVVLAHAIYGWMPTILEMGYLDKGGSSKVVEAIRTIGKIELDRISDYSRYKEDFRILARFTNNSFVGLSKLLHFLFPENYAIWDDNINNLLKLGCTANNVNNFVVYQTAMKCAKKKLAQKQSGISLREIEEHLFYLGK